MPRATLEEAPLRYHSLNGGATERGATYGHITKRRASIRRTEHSGHEVARSCARCFRVLPVLAGLWPSRIRAKGLVRPGKPLEAAVQDDFEMMASDPMALALLPDELRDASHEVKQFFVNLYIEATTGQPGRTLRSLSSALDLLQHAALNEANYEAQLANFREEIACVA
jgi:hypothetical protein